MFDKTDLAKHKAFKTIVMQSKIEMKGDAAIMVASLFQWFNGLEDKIEKSINPPPLKGKKVKPPIKELK